MDKNKLDTIFKYIMVCAVIIYFSISTALNFKYYVDSDKKSYLVMGIIATVIVVLSLVCLVLLIRKSLYRAKFTHNDFK